MINLDDYKSLPIQKIVIEDLDNLNITIPATGEDRNVNVKLLNPNNLAIKINGTENTNTEILLEDLEYNITA